jgi:hypothetical protein
MTKKIESEMVSRRSTFSFLGSAVALALAVPAMALAAAEAEAETAGMKRRQERRAGRHKRREERRTGHKTPAEAAPAAPATTPPKPAQ